MKNRTCYAVFGVLLALSAALMTYNHFVLLPRQGETFTLSPLGMFSNMVGTPIFWTCLGALLAFALTRQMADLPLLGGLFWVGVALLAGYGVLLALYLGANVSVPVILWLLQMPPVFLVPGVLIGTGL